MAIYHLSTKPISRGKGRSAVAAASYRSATRLVDRRTGLAHDYTKRRDRIDTWIQAPEGAPAWAHDREELWNFAEAAERRKDSRVAREVEVALPKELTEDQQRDLVAGFVRERFVSLGMVADVAIHRGNHQNPHVHILLTTRPLDGKRFASKKPDKEPGWGDTPRDVHRLRESWERHANRELERSGSWERISCRSYKDRGIRREPTVHEGPDVREMESRGLRTDRGERNREVRRRNTERERLLEDARRDPLGARLSDRVGERGEEFDRGRDRDDGQEIDRF